ncbi:MAG TPA: 16S rRNA (uracil(1498)-N(3))-methyltransferase [Papillibacter sp.]|nr:16S rRNA (uracil(1498)-N(3))-methyltransferase [Papillibacter sp.]
MARFFVAATNIFGGVACLSTKEAQHLRVLRIRRGEHFTVCDGQGTDYICRLRSIDEGGAEAEIVSTKPSNGEPTVDVAVYAAFSKGDKLETLVQKSVEMGASRIVVFPSARCVSRPSAASSITKTARLQKIAEEAAKQSGRGKVPGVTVSPSFEQAVKSAAACDVGLFLYECEKDNDIRSVLRSRADYKTLAIMSGPEGGFAPEEADYAAEQGMLKTGLGPRILRCETAPIAALAAVMYETDNMK